MPEIKLDDGQFMGHTLRRTDVCLHDRQFTPIPVRPDAAQAKRSDAVDAARYAAGSLARSAMAAQSQLAQNASPVMSLHTMRQAVQGLRQNQAAHAANPPVMYVPKERAQAIKGMLATGTGVVKVPAGTLKDLKAPAPCPRERFKVFQTPYRAGKSWVSKMIQHLKPKPEITQAVVGMDMAALEQRIAGRIGSGLPLPPMGPLKFRRPVAMTLHNPGMDAVEDVEQSYHPLRSAYPHAHVDRAVPAVRVDAQPSFFLDDTVGAALENTIGPVCETKRGTNLANDVRRMRDAVYRPEGLYRPDEYSRQQQQAWSSVTTASIFSSQTIELNKGWELDIRHATGVYRASGRAWVGVFVFGIAMRSGTFTGARGLSPSDADKEQYRLNLRGDTMDSLVFDLFVPCEPEIVTEEWGWGDDMEELQRQREVNAMRDAKAAQTSAGVFTDNKWDQKAKRHKSAVEIRKTQMQIDTEAKQLLARYEKALHERERARQVLYSYAWKALMLAVMECRQLTVEKIHE